MKMLQMYEDKAAPPREVIIAEALEMDDAILHRVDREDVKIAPEAMRSLCRMAKSVLAEYAPDPASVPEILRQILNSVGREAYWDEGSMSLVVCLTMFDDDHFIRIPRSHWSWRQDGSVH